MTPRRLAILGAISALCCCLIVFPSSAISAAAAESSKSGSQGQQTATQSRQSAASMLGAIGSLVPSLISNVAPLVLLFGLGALMMPSLGMGLLRESRRSANDQPNNLANMNLQSAFAQYARPLQTSPQDIYYLTARSFPSLLSNVNTASVLHGAHQLLERVVRAIDNADKRYS